MKQGLLIGIDGGGTHSTAVAAWPDGRVAAVAYGGGLNFHNDGVETVRLRLEDLVDELCRKSGAHAAKICVGMSALDAPADEATLAMFTNGRFSPGQLDLQSDAYIALMGFTRGHPGMIVICGTGSMLLLLDEAGRQLVSGGWGYLLGDAGSGYTLSREGLLAVIDEYEGLAPSTALTAHALSYFSIESPRALIDRFYSPECTPDKVAGFARHVLTEAAAGDAVASAILCRNMDKLAAQAARLLSKSGSANRTGLYGGIFAHSAAARERFTKTLLSLSPATEICSPDYTPELGAIIHLMLTLNTLNDNALTTLKRTYEEAKQ